MGLNGVTPLQGLMVSNSHPQGWHPGLSCYAPLGLVFLILPFRPPLHLFCPLNFHKPTLAKKHNEIHLTSIDLNRRNIVCIRLL